MFLRIALWNVILFCSFSCNTNSDIPEINIENNIAQYRRGNATSDTLSMMTFLPLDNWEKVLVIHPYAKEEEIAMLNLKNYSSCKKLIKDITYTDFYYLIVFLYNDNAVAYSKVSPKFLSSMTKNNDSTLSYNIITKEDFYLILKKP